MSKIFISYKRLDKDVVLPIKDKIEALTGEKCWIDLDGIESDAQFKNVIIKAINQCEIMLFMYSKLHSQITDFEKDWTVKEVNFAQKKEKRIVFVNIDGTPLTDAFEFDFGTKQQVDARDSERVDKLIKDIKVWLNTERNNGRDKGNSILCSNDAEKKYKITLVDAGAAKLLMVKLVKEMLGWGLKESKDFVDSVPSVFPGFYSESEMQELSHFVEGNGGVLQKVCIQENTSRISAQKAAMIGRNDPCPCGSGKKYKNCHGKYI